MMVAKLWEKPKSQSGEVPFFGQTAQKQFGASGCTDESALMALLIGNPLIPAINVVGGASLFIEKFSYKEFGGGCWDVTANYKGAGNQWRLSADTSGGTKKLFYSQATISSTDCTGAGGAVPDFKRAIGVTSSGIDGVDVVDPKFDLTINATLKFSVLSVAYLKTLYALTGQVNDSPYSIFYKGQVLQFDAEELLFRGVSFNQTSTDDLDITYKFSGQKSTLIADNQTIGASPVILKQGWRYLWVYFEEVNDSTTNRILRKPIAAYVEQVFKLGDFTQIAL